MFITTGAGEVALPGTDGRSTMGLSPEATSEEPALATGN